MGLFNKETDKEMLVKSFVTGYDVAAGVLSAIKEARAYADFRGILVENKIECAMQTDPNVTNIMAYSVLEDGMVFMREFSGGSPLWVPKEQGRPKDEGMTGKIYESYLGRIIYGYKDGDLRHCRFEIRIPTRENEFRPGIFGDGKLYYER